MLNNQRRGRLPELQPWVTYVLLGLIIFSLFLHLLTWLAISRVRTLAKQQINELAAQVGQAETSVLTANFQVTQSVPINTNIPIEKNLLVPISTNVDIDDQIEIPLDTPLGTYQVPVPIRVSVPINTTIPISVSETFAINTTVDLDMNVPISIPVADTSLATYLQQLRERLEQLSKDL
jgi:hypothetical protein